MSDYKLLIGGQLVAGDSTMDVINPATEEVLAVCPRGSERQMNAAVAAAKAAFKGWAKTPIDDRRACVSKLADAIEARTTELARLLTEIGASGVTMEDHRLEHSPGAQIGLAEISVLPEVEQQLTDELESRGWRMAGASL